MVHIQEKTNLIEILTSILSAGVILATPILFAALGEIYDERAGVLNLGIEGMMALTALVALWVTYSTGSYLTGILAAMLVGVLVAMIHSFGSVTIGINQIISGLLIFSLAQAIANFSYRSISTLVIPSVQPLKSSKILGLSEIPVLGPFLFQHDVLVYLSFFLAIVLGFILYKTSWGLKIRGVGENPLACEAAGIDVNRTRHVCVAFSGVMAALGGAYLTLGYLGIYDQGIVAGRGWVAIVVVILSGWDPFRAILGSLIFGLGYSIASTLIGAGVGIPYYFLMMLPYMLALTVILFLKRKRAPAALAIPYRRR